MKLLVSLIALSVVSSLLVHSVFAYSTAEAMAMAKDCVFNLDSCDCSLLASEAESQGGDGAEAVAFCEKEVGYAQNCITDLQSPDCEKIDLTAIENSFSGGSTLRSLIEDRVRSYIPEIKNCVNLENCDCSAFPKGVDEFCQNYVTKQDACLNGYDLDACNMLDNQEVEVLPSWTPSWVRTILEPLIRPLVQFRQQMMETQAIGSAMTSVASASMTLIIVTARASSITLSGVTAKREEG